MIMAQKILAGVYHDKERLPKTLQTIVNYNPFSIGLELPEDYEKRENLNISYPFFRDIVSFLKPRNRKIIPLEDPEFLDYYGAVDLAKLIMEGHIAKEKIQQDLARLTKIDMRYMAPEQCYWSILRSGQCNEALHFVNNYNHDSILSLWQQANRDREEHMIKNINRYHPEMIIVGDFHAQIMATVLPEYKYIVIK